MFWTIFWILFIGYPLMGLMSLRTITRDEYRRRRIKNPDEPEDQRLEGAASQGWANALFWPVYLLMHASLSALEKDAAERTTDQRTQQYLNEVRDPKSWDQRYNETEKEAHERRFLSGEGE